MNFGKGGQNIVQAGNGGGNVFRGATGSILGKFLDTKLKRQERDYNRGKDLESRKEFEDYKNISKVKHDTLSDMIRPAAAAHGARQAYEIALETHPEDHPNAGKFVNEEMANQVKRYGFDVGYRPAKTPASITQVEQWQRYRDENPKVTSKKTDTGNNKVDTSAAIASSPVGGFNPKESDIQESLHANNNPNYFPFESTAGSSGKFSPNKFDNGQPVFSELDAEDIRAENLKTPFDTKEGYKERTAHLIDGINDGKGGNK
jgi:hypothetical protein